MQRASTPASLSPIITPTKQPITVRQDLTAKPISQSSEDEKQSIPEAASVENKTDKSVELADSVVVEPGSEMSTHNLTELDSTLLDDKSETTSQIHQPFLWVPTER